MGKLYELVEFRNHLMNQLDHLCLDKSIQEKVKSLEKDQRVFPKYSDYTNQILKDYELLKQQNQKTIKNVLEQIYRLNLLIDNASLIMTSKQDYLNIFHEINIQGSEFVNSLFISSELESIIVSKITEYSDWHYPALQISPNNKKWIDPMVAGDPLYLTHYYKQILIEIIKPYPQLYQNRLRLYEIQDRNFSKLPEAQFSFVLCWDYFNYLSPNFVEKYLREVWNLLRPGGRFMFSYTNCDLSGPALRAESLACAYASSRWLKKLCAEIGYEISELQDHETEDAFNTNVSWAIVSKPGRLSTVKSGQAMAEILTK